MARAQNLPMALSFAHARIVLGMEPLTKALGPIWLAYMRPAANRYQLARPDIEAARDAARAAVDALDEALEMIDREQKSVPVQVGDAAASAVMDGVAAGGGVQRLVPRDASAFKGFPPSGNGPEAA